MIRNLSLIRPLRAAYGAFRSDVEQPFLRAPAFLSSFSRKTQASQAISQRLVSFPTSNVNSKFAYDSNVFGMSPVMKFLDPASENPKSYQWSAELMVAGLPISRRVVFDFVMEDESGKLVPLYVGTTRTKAFGLVLYIYTMGVNWASKLHLKPKRYQNWRAHKPCRSVMCSIWEALDEGRFVGVRYRVVDSLPIAKVIEASMHAIHEYPHCDTKNANVKSAIEGLRPRMIYNNSFLIDLHNASLRPQQKFLTSDMANNLAPLLKGDQGGLLKQIRDAHVSVVTNGKVSTLSALLNHVGE